MSDQHIPFEIQSEIIKNLPAKSILQFRSISKQWKSLIDSSEFIKNYHLINQHYLLVEHSVGYVRTYTSIIDDNTFPQQKYPLTAPESLYSLIHTYSITSVNGLLCFFGSFGDFGSNNMMAVIWNPSIRKSVSIVIPNVLFYRDKYTVIGFGVCPHTCDPKFVKIKLIKIIKPYQWVVEVFTLSTRVWKTVYTGAPFKSCDYLSWKHVFIDGIIYWQSVGYEGIGSNYIISFDLKGENFGQVSLSERLARAPDLVLAKGNESLHLLEYYNEGEISVCGVWMKKDGVNEPFTKIYTIRVEGKSVLKRVLDFTKNGEVVLEMEDDIDRGYNVEVYEPSSGHINGVGINGNARFSAVSYTETLLLLNEPNSIIHG